MSFLIPADEQSLKFFVGVTASSDIFVERFVEYKDVKNVFLTTKGKVIFCGPDYFVLADDLATFEFSVLIYQKFFIMDYQTPAIVRYIVRWTPLSEEELK